MIHENQPPATAEANSQAPGLDSRETAWLAFQYWTGSEDRPWFELAYLGHWQSRGAFGRQLASQFGADARLSRLPRWLQPYLRLDGERITADFEAAGHFFVSDLPDDGGIHVFDCHT